MKAVSMVVLVTIIGANGKYWKIFTLYFVCFLLSGLIQIELSFAGFGKYIKYIPYPVVSGFMTAIGVIILITQLLPVLGYHVENDQDLINQDIPVAEEQILDKILIDEPNEGLLVLKDFKKLYFQAERVSQHQILIEATHLSKNQVQESLAHLELFLKRFLFLILLSLD